MNILAFDTATDICTVALHCGSETLELNEHKPQQQAALLLPSIDKLIAQAGIQVSQLDGIVFGRGPGSFTGLRIAASTAQGIALGADIGVIGISTLACLAQGCARETQATNVLVLLDARLSEVYCSRYSIVADGVAAPMSEEQLLAPAQLQAIMQSDSPLTVCGSGLNEYRDAITPLIHNHIQLDENRLPNANDLITLAMPTIKKGVWLPPEAALPVYIRDQVALTEAQRNANKG